MGDRTTHVPADIRIVDGDSIVVTSRGDRAQVDVGRGLLIGRSWVQVAQLVERRLHS